jgi:hypothetical protein
MDPAELGDEAFLRRIQTKIKLGSVTDEQFSEIFRRVTQEHRIDNDPSVVAFLIDYIRNFLKQDLRSCYPRDIVNQILWSARYEGVRPIVDHTTATRAIEAYFLPPS